MEQPVNGHTGQEPRVDRVWKPGKHLIWQEHVTGPGAGGVLHFLDQFSHTLTTMPPDSLVEFVREGMISPNLYLKKVQQTGFK